MTHAEPMLKTQRVAQALGVSVSTVKRWVDSGMIQAARTVGKHRLIPKSEALRLARAKGFAAEKIEALSGLGSSQIHRIGDAARETLETLLIEGRAREARFLIDTLHTSGQTAVALADELVRPVMQRIGHGWMAGKLDVYQEHAATRIMASSLVELIGRDDHDPHDGSRPLALGAAPEGDPYVLPGLLGELVLLESGWRVQNLGVNLPLRSLASATVRLWPRLIFISVSYLVNEDQFVSEYQSFYEAAAAVNAAVILGGNALTPDLRSRLLYASFGDRMAHLAEFARQIQFGSSPVLAKDETPTSDQNAT